MRNDRQEALLLIDKPQGWTSFDVVRKVNFEFKRKYKVGHAGSLDPFATGLLVLLMGKATKLSATFTDLDKTYLATVKLGARTDTLDRTGRIVETASVPPLSDERIQKVLGGLVGPWTHLPPMYSAKKVDGVRLYELARKDKEVERKPITVSLFELNFRRYEAPYLTFDVTSSKGTYIRSLAEEVARRLGTVGYLSELRRLECGSFLLEDAAMLEQLKLDPGYYLDKGADRFREVFLRESLQHRRLRRETEVRA